MVFEKLKSKMFQKHIVSFLLRPLDAKTIDMQNAGG